MSFRLRPVLLASPVALAATGEAFRREFVHLEPVSAAPGARR